MRQRWGLGVGLAFAVGMAGCIGPGSQITGTVTVASGFPNKDVFVALWIVPANSSAPTTPTGEPSFVNYFDLGTVSSSGGTFPYAFDELSPGLYLVGAYLDTPADLTPDIEADVHDLAENNLILIDPSVKSESSGTLNLFLGESEPGLATFTGTVHLSAAAAAVPVSVLVMSENPLTDANAELVDQQTIASGGTTIPYQLFNEPAAPSYIIGWADMNENGQIDFDTDMFAFALQNPVTVGAPSDSASGIDLWLGAQDPSLGSIAGTLSLTAQLPSFTTSILAFSSDYFTDANANAIGLVNVTGTSTNMATFSLPSMPLGSVYLYALTETAAVTIPGTDVSGSTPYTAGTNADAVPIELTTASPNASSVTYTIGAGRVTGSIALTNTPSAVTEGWVAATQSVQGNILVAGEAQVALSAGASMVKYELFGLLDGTYSITFVPDIADTGNLSDDTMYAAEGSCTGSTTSSVTIASASTGQCTFSYTFQ